MLLLYFGKNQLDYTFAQHNVVVSRHDEHSYSSGCYRFHETRISSGGRFDDDYDDIDSLSGSLLLSLIL